MRRSRFAQAGFIVLFIAGCGAPASAVPRITPAVPSAAVTAAPSTPPPSDGLESLGPSGTSPSIAPTDWVPVQDQPASSETQLTDVVWTGSRFVAAGTFNTSDPVFVDSIDGQTWNVQPRISESARVQDLAVEPEGVIAVGLEGSDARSWFSKDGLTWTAAPITRALRPTAGRVIRMNGVTWTGTAWLAVGEEDTACEYNCDSASSDQAVVWSSVNGLDWTRAPQTASLKRAAMNGVARGGAGFVAVGGAPDRPATTQVAQHAVVWTSTNGRTWSRVPDAPVDHAPAGTDQAFGDSMSSIASDGTHLVAVGTVATQGDVGSALAWVSTDGRTWQRGSASDFLNGQLFNVAAVPGGFLGTGPSGTDSCLGGIWFSADGAAWTCIATDSSIGGYAAYAAAASPTTMVVVGLPTTEVSIPASIWTRPTP
jgi:hypothetical protein